MKSLEIYQLRLAGDLTPSGMKSCCHLSWKERSREPERRYFLYVFISETALMG